MSSHQPAQASPRKPLRLWPGVVAAFLQWLIWWVAPIVLPMPIGAYTGAFALLLGALAIIVWWTFFSRAPRIERWGAIALMLVAMAVTPRFLDRSIATGNLGFQFFLYAVPVLSLAFVVWAVAARRLSSGPRRATLIATILLACGVFTLLRSDGLTGDGAAQFAWRWAQTPEQRLLAQTGNEPAALASAMSAAPSDISWPGFRGADRDGVIHGLRIETDWTATPPVELWRRPIGPGVSSFAAGGDRIYTQEQRGEDEVVSCYDLTTGDPVWRHGDPARFWDPHVGAGPRATPALANGRVYAFGATGILNALDAADGSIVWSRDVSADTDTQPPSFGFVSSPLVVDDVVIVLAGTLVAYNLATGELRWTGPARRGSYSSPHLLTLDGVAQVLQITGDGVASVSPSDGDLLWEHPWPGLPIMQPARTEDGDVLISMVSDAAGPLGTRRLALARGAGGWTVEELWTSTGLKPNISDIVVHDGHAYGFDGNILASIDLADGARNWKGGRYGSGRVLLLSDQGLLLVVSEQGELVLVRAAPDRFTELARFPAIEGKTWSNPTMVGDRLLVRNNQEMAAFRLPATGR